MKVAEHLKALHTHHAEHFTKRARHHSQMHEHITRLADSLTKSKSDMQGQEEAGESLHEMAALHKAMSGECADMAEFHIGCAKSFDSTGKAMGFNDGDELAPLPDGLSVIRGDAPPRMVARPGMPELPINKIDPQFEKLFAE
jgi:hypothetical protein